MFCQRGRRGKGKIQRTDHAEVGSPILKKWRVLPAFYDKLVHLLFNCGCHGMGACTAPYTKTSDKEAHAYGLPPFMWEMGRVDSEDVTVILICLADPRFVHVWVLNALLFLIAVCLFASAGNVADDVSVFPCG
jgi:hypothetical protein